MVWLQKWFYYIFPWSMGYIVSAFGYHQYPSTRWLNHTDTTGCHYNWRSSETSLLTASSFGFQKRSHWFPLLGWRGNKRWERAFKLNKVIFCVVSSVYHLTWYKHLFKLWKQWRTVECTAFIKLFRNISTDSLEKDNYTVIEFTVKNVSTFIKIKQKQEYTSY